MAKKNYWWNDKPEIGVYDFCYDEAKNYDFWIIEVAVNYVYGWTEEERQCRFKGAKFVFGGCCGGVSCSNNPLKAETVEEAKKEFEAWYEQLLSDRVDAMEKALAAATEEHELFLVYKEKDHGQNEPSVECNY